MFRAVSCSSSGGQMVLIQHLVSSLSVSDRPVHNLCTGQSLTDSDDTRCCINTIWPPEDEQDIVRNMYMYRIVINVLKFCASSWSLAKVILRCTFSETSNHCFVVIVGTLVTNVPTFPNVTTVSSAPVFATVTWMCQKFCELLHYTHERLTAAQDDCLSCC